MPLDICVLGSGSKGNCIYVASDQTRILIDAGLSGKETIARLACIDVELESIEAICITHEHSDHKDSIGVISRKCPMPVFVNSGALESMENDKRMIGVDWNVFTTGHSFEIGDLRLDPFSVPHDAYEPVGFAITSGESRVGIVTDMGMATSLIRERLKDCDAAVVESNHDEEMLKESQRPWSLKQRIGGRQGHLSNKQAAELIVEISGLRLKTVFLAHLSGDCNLPSMALRETVNALKENNITDIEVKLTYSSKVSDLVRL